MKLNELKAIQLARENENFKLVDMYDKSQRSEKSIEKTNHSDRTDKTDKSEDNTKRKASAMDDDEDDEDPYVKDQRQKIEFVDRLRKRDEERTKKLLEIKLGAKEEEEVKSRRQIAEIPKDERPEFVDRLRLVSPICKDRNLRRLKEEIEDNGWLFGEVDITDYEKKEQEGRRKILDVVVKAQQNREDFDDDYQIPEDDHDHKGLIDQKKKWELLTKRYNRREEENNQTINIEQEEWEDTQQ